MSAPLFIYLCLPWAVAQSSTVMPATILQSLSSTTKASDTSDSMITATQATGTLNGWETGDFVYSDLLREGMKPAAASYVVQQRYETNSAGELIQFHNENEIFDAISDSPLETEGFRQEGLAQQLTVEGMFIDVLQNSDARAFESSFMSVWYSYQSATPDPSISASLRSKFNARTSTTSPQASSSAGAGLPAADINLGSLVGAIMGLAAFL